MALVIFYNIFLYTLECCALRWTIEKIWSHFYDRKKNKVERAQKTSRFSSCASQFGFAWIIDVQHILIASIDTFVLSTAAQHTHSNSSLELFLRKRRRRRWNWKFQLLRTLCRLTIAHVLGLGRPLDRLLTSFKLISLNEVNLCSMGKFAFVRALIRTSYNSPAVMCWHRVTSHRILSPMLITFDLQLQACVGRRMTWCDTTLCAIALFGANFSQWKNLPHRQKIWRAMWDSDLRWTWSNLLLLFCGIYRTSSPLSFLSLCRCAAAALLLLGCNSSRNLLFSVFVEKKKWKMLKLVWRRKTEANESREFFSRKNGGSSRWSSTAEGEKVLFV